VNRVKRVGPPAEHRFQKGTSGNPKGRPRKAKQRNTSAFEVVLDKSLTVTTGREIRELTIEEALQHRTYQDALAGNRSARREVLKMIAKREKWLADNEPKSSSPRVEVKSEWADPDNHCEAMLLLGIAGRDAVRDEAAGGKYQHYLLQPWAVQAALSRSGSKNINEKAVSEIKRCTRDPESLRWPASLRS
jgi:hypothetical protein